MTSFSNISGAGFTSAREEQAEKNYATVSYKALKLGLWPWPRTTTGYVDHLHTSSNYM
jgi:hypothetical protein